MKSKIGCIFLFLILFITLFSVISQLNLIKKVYATSGIIRVQGNFQGKNQINVGSVNVNLASTPTQYNMLVLVMTSRKTTSPYAHLLNITETGVIWTLQISKEDTSTKAIEIWCGIVGSSASANITCFINGLATSIIVNVCEYSGLSTVNFLDTSASKGGAGEYPSNSSWTNTTTISDELWIGGCAYAYTQTGGLNNYTMLDGTLPYTALSNAYLERIVSQTELNRTYTGTTSSTSSGYWACAVICLKGVKVDFTDASVTSKENDASTILKINCTITVGYNISFSIFCWNETGSQVNDTEVSQVFQTGYINTTKDISVNVGDIIQWKIYINSTANDNFNFGSEWQNFTVEATITFLQYNENCTFRVNGTNHGNNTSITYNSPTVLNLGCLPDNNFSFINFTWFYDYSIINSYNFTVKNQTSIFCYVIEFVSGNGTTSFICARFTFNNSAPYLGETVFFNGTYSNCSSPITSFLWNFGDNITLEGNTTTHIYISDGVFTVNLTVVSGSMSDTFLQQISVLATTITVNFDLPFFLLIFLVAVCLILCVIRVPIIGFVFSAFAIGFSAWTLTDTSLPLYGILNTFVAVIGVICLYLNIQKFVDSGYAKKHTSKLAKRF